jgi:hypothetical protein
MRIAIRRVLIGPGKPAHAFQILFAPAEEEFYNDERFPADDRLEGSCEPCKIQYDGRSPLIIGSNRNRDGYFQEKG